jgi:tetratricopeptide (TPR) repeat protein
VFGILATLGLSVGLFLWRRRHPGLLAAWLSYLVILAPNLGLIPVGNYIVADRYSYIAMLGVVVLVAAGFSRICQASRLSWPAATLLSAAGLGVLVSLVLLSREQCRTWRSSEALWAHAVNHDARRSYVARMNLGEALNGQGRLAEAQAEYAEAVRLNPGSAGAHYDLAHLLRRQGRLAEAEAEYAEAVRLDPANAEAHNNLGALLMLRGAFKQAHAEFTEALRLNPNYAAARANLEMVLKAKGRLDESGRK